MKIMSTQQSQHVRGGVVIFVIGTIAGVAGTLSGLFYHMTHPPKIDSNKAQGKTP